MGHAGVLAQGAGEFGLQRLGRAAAGGQQGVPLLAGFGQGGEEADAHLKLLALREQREAYVAGLLEIEPAALTLGGKKAIARWYEVYGYDDAMVQEAAVQAGPKRDLWYWNSILKTWNAKGLRTVRDVRGPAPLAGASRNLRVDRETPSGNDFLQGALDRPRRHKRKD